MKKQLLFIAILGLAIILGVTFAGYKLGKIAEKRGTPSPSPSSSNLPSASPATPAISATATAVASPAPTEKPVPTKSPTPKPKVLPTAPPQEQSLINRSQFYFGPVFSPTSSASQSKTSKKSSEWKVSTSQEQYSETFIDIN